MLKGIQLKLMAGIGLHPRPVSQDVIEALENVEVRQSKDSVGACQLTFSLSQKSKLHKLFLLGVGGLPDVFRIILSVSINGTSQVLFDGVLTNTEVSPGDQGIARLTVTAEDLTRVMDYVERTGFPYPLMSASARVFFLLSNYAPFGIIPDAKSLAFQFVPNPIERIPAQTGTDLFYIRKLAKEAGFVFYIEPGRRPKENYAYWGPDVHVGRSHRALSANMDAITNVDALNFTFDSQSAEQPVAYVQEPFAKTSIPVPIPSLKTIGQPLAKFPPIPRKIRQIKDTESMSMPEALQRILGESLKSQNSTRGSGTVDTLRYGEILKPRRLIGVRGAGNAYDGQYLIESVTYQIKRGSFMQQFSIVRNGLGSTVRRVRA